MFQVSKHEVTHGLGSMFQDVDRHPNREYDFIRARTEPLPRQYPLPLHKVQGRYLFLKELQTMLNFLISSYYSRTVFNLGPRIYL
jgi:hypothetical protein